jgi:hypothetical protein
MLAMYFTHDGGDTSKWRVKGHAQAAFWTWMASWAVMIRKPSDLGYSDDGFILPPLHMHEHCVSVHAPSSGFLFAVEAQTLQERQAARRDSIGDRVAACADLVNSSDRPFLVWCNLNAESEALAAAIPDAVEVQGSDTDEHKEAAIVGFLDGRYRVMISKPKIAGLGLNLQHCADMAFVGLSDSYEQLYQSIRRCWRFGQSRPVNVHVITAETEGAVVSNIKRKEREAEETYNSMIDPKGIYSVLRSLADRGNLKRKEGKNRLDVKYKYVTDSKEWPETGGKKAPERPRGARSISVEHANEALASPPVALVRATGLPPLPPDGRRVLITHDDLADGTHIEIIAEELPDVMERFRLEGRKNVEVWSRASLRVTLE